MKVININQRFLVDCLRL